MAPQCCRAAPCDQGIVAVEGLIAVVRQVTARPICVWVGGNDVERDEANLRTGGDQRPLRIARLLMAEPKLASLDRATSLLSRSRVNTSTRFFRPPQHRPEPWPKSRSSSTPRKRARTRRRRHLNLWPGDAHGTGPTPDPHSYRPTLTPEKRNISEPSPCGQPSRWLTWAFSTRLDSTLNFQHDHRPPRRLRDPVSDHLLQPEHSS